MTNSQRLETVRELLRLWLADRNTETSTDSPDDTGASIAAEAILIREGYYAGRTFELLVDSTHLRAVWFMEQDELKVRDASGSLLVNYCGEEIDAAISALTVAETVEPQAEEVGPVSIPMPTGEPVEPAAEKPDSQGDDATVDDASEGDSLPKAA